MTPSSLLTPTDATPPALFHRLGIDSLPAHETLQIAVESIIIPEADQVRPPARLVRSIKQVGILQAPAVELLPGSSLGEPEARYRIIFGRRRILAARLAGLPTVKCEAYASGTPHLASLLALIENVQRSQAWIKEIQDLRHLIDDQVGMTLNDLATFGFNRGSLVERLKIAQLPAPILTSILAGQVSLPVAKRLAHLGPSQQQHIADHIAGGEQITPELVRNALRKQVNEGLAPLQKTLTLPLAEEGGGNVEAMNISGVPLPSGKVPPDPAEVVSPHALLTQLEAFQHQLRPGGASAALQLLLESLIQELRLVARTSARSSHGLPTLVSQGEPHHA